ncbi:hypothetical protein CDAR_369701, partial [Caerostris darwini]
MDTISSTSVMASKLENCLGSLVETTTRLSESSSVRVDPQKCPNQPRKIFHAVEITSNLAEDSSVRVEPQKCSNQLSKTSREVKITKNLSKAR